MLIKDNTSNTSCQDFSLADYAVEHFGAIRLSPVPVSEANPSLVTGVKTARKLKQDKRRKNRCFHRVISGLEVGGDLRLLTLTTKSKDKKEVNRWFRMLTMRLIRRGLLKAYVRVPELGSLGYIHLHIIFRGSYLEQKALSALWLDISGYPVVWISRVRNKRGAASYLAKYMSKSEALAGHYSWSWSWVWKGFCRDWDSLKRVARLWECDYKWLLSVWKYHLKHGYNRLNWSLVLRWQSEP